MSDQREERIARNEILFREINERVKDVQESFGASPEEAQFVCECGNLECLERIAMSIVDYDALRRDPTTFAVVPGHEAQDAEDVVEARPRHLVVRKHPGVAAEIAREEHPRP